MSILFLIPTLSQGGAESFLLKFAIELSKNKNISIHIFVLQKDLTMVPKTLPENIKIKEFGLSKSVKSACSFIKFYKNVKKLSPDVIHSHMFFSNIIARLFKNKKNKIINHYHGLSPWFNFFHYALEKITQKYVDYCIVTSQQSFDLRLQREKIAKNKLKLVYNSISLPLEYKKNSHDNKNFIFGMACRLIPLKNIELAIDYIFELNKINNIYSLTIAGDGPEKEKIKKYIEKRELKSKVQLLGFVANMDTFYKHIDGLIITSDIEDFPMTAIEAMSYNLPVLSKPLGDIPQLVKSGKGIILNTLNEQEVRKINHFVLDSFNKTDIKNRLAIETNYSMSNCKNRIMSLYEK